MKVLFLALICFSFLLNDQHTLIEKVSIGKYNFLIYKEDTYAHDEDLHAEFFVVYSEKKKRRLCSAFSMTKRNDTVFKKGVYALDKNKLIFKEYNFYKHKKQSDSLVKIFVPDNTGNLKLSEVLDYNNGQVEKLNY